MGSSATDAVQDALSRLIRDVPDFPKPGILFKDITPLLADADGFALAVDSLAECIVPYRPTALAGIESRGFIFASALAHKLRLPLQLVRKPGKLPWHSAAVDYELEYGSDRLEMHRDAAAPGDRVAVIDDLLATGGTAAATVRLLKELGADVCCAAFVIELGFLDGRRQLDGVPVEYLLGY